MGEFIDTHTHTHTYTRIYTHTIIKLMKQCINFIYLSVKEIIYFSAVWPSGNIVAYWSGIFGSNFRLFRVIFLWVENYSVLCMDCVFLSVWFVRVMSCVVFGGGPFTLLTSDQGTPSNFFLSLVHQKSTPDTTKSRIKYKLKKKKKMFLNQELW